jgi:general secretion pathway protein D
MKKNSLLLSSALSLMLVQGLAQEPAPDPNEKITIEQPRMNADILALHYKAFTGKRVIVSNAAQSKVVSLVSPGEMTRAEAAVYLEKACLLEGLVFVPSGVDEVKLVTSEDAKIQGGLPYVTDTELLPPGDAVASYFMKLDFISPDEALRSFQAVFGSVKPHGSIAVIDNANALIITENANLIKKLVEVKKSIDIPQASVSRKMIQLEHADAETLSQQINEIVSAQLEKKGQVNRSPNAPRAANSNQSEIQQADVAGSAVVPSAPANVDAGQIQAITVFSETRTNSIFVMGRPIDILFVENLVSDFDQPIKIRNSFTHRLKYLPVSEFLPVLESGIKQVMGDSLFSNNSGGVSSINDNGRSTSNSISNSSRNRGGSGSSGGSEGSGSTGGNSLQNAERDEKPISLLVGKTLLVADNTNNTLIVQGPPQSIDIAKTLIKQMDIAGKQVQITAVFGRYTMNDDSNFGVDYARVNSSSDGRALAGNTQTGFPIIVDPNSIVGPEDFPNPANALAGLALYGQVGTNFFTYLRALESDGRFKLLSRPTLFTTNNRKAVLSSGQRIAVPTSTLSSGTVNDSVTQNTNIEFRDVLLLLEVVPLVNSDEEVTLNIFFQNDNVVGNRSINGNDIPTIGTEELLTTVKVPNNGTIVLGGLITERANETVSGVPILKSIPGIGKLFSSTKKESVKEELVILIQPRIVDGARSLSDLQDFNAQRSDIIDSENGNILLPDIGELEKSPEPSRNVTRSTEQDPKPAPIPSAPAATPVENSPRDRFRGGRR